MVLFVGSSVVQDLWVNWGLPHIYYWDVKKEHLNMINGENHDNNNFS